MKKDLCWIIFCIDRSGSMSIIRNDMIGGFNTFIKSQRDLKIGECRVFAYKFDTQYDVMFENLDINDVPLLTEANYVPGGGTALYDSLGKTIEDIGIRLSNLPEDERPEKVLVVTITDGEDNSSLIGDVKHFNNESVKTMVKHQKEVYSWDFAYIGANQDSWAVGSSMGYSMGTTLNYTADSKGTAMAFGSLSDSTTKYRRYAGATFNFCPSSDDDEDDTVSNIATPKRSHHKKKA